MGGVGWSITARLCRWWRGWTGTRPMVDRCVVRHPPQSAKDAGAVGAVCGNARSVQGPLGTATNFPGCPGHPGSRGIRGECQ